MHLKALRAFVESVLRFGLPVNFMSALVLPRKKGGSAGSFTRSHLYTRSRLSPVAAKLARAHARSQRSAKIDRSLSFGAYDDTGVEKKLRDKLAKLYGRLHGAAMLGAGSGEGGKGAKAEFFPYVSFDIATEATVG